MTNSQASLLAVAAIFAAILSGQAAHWSPTGNIGEGFLIMLKESISLIVGMVGRGSNWVVNSIWFLETLKNVFQAALFAGAALFGIFADEPPKGKSVENLTTVVGFLVFSVLMAAVTRRVEILRRIESQSEKN